MGNLFELTLPHWESSLSLEEAKGFYKSAMELYDEDAGIPSHSIFPDTYTDICDLPINMPEDANEDVRQLMAKKDLRQLIVKL